MLFGEFEKVNLNLKPLDFKKKIIEKEILHNQKNNENNPNNENVPISNNSIPKKLEKSHTMQIIKPKTKILEIPKNEKEKIKEIKKPIKPQTTREKERPVELKTKKNDPIIKKKEKAEFLNEKSSGKKLQEKLPQLKIKGLKPTKRQLSTMEDSPLKNSDFDKKAKKFNSIVFTDLKNENLIAESINFNNSAVGTEKFDDGSVETVQSVDCSSQIVQNLASKDDKEVVEETFENEFFEKGSNFKEVNFEKVKIFKNSSLITMKNNAKVVLERKDNLENKGFINEIEKLMCQKEERSNFLFDPVLKSFYDPKTQTYYHKI